MPMVSTSQQNGNDQMEENDEENEMEDVSDEHISALKQRIMENENDYEAHLSLVKALRANGDLDELMEARKRFSMIFPLTPKLWIEWINDEMAIGGDRERVGQLFERAIGDYVSPELWIEYVQWACGSDLNIARQIMERAVEAVGLRVDSGRLLWQSYIDLERLLIGQKDDSKAKSRLLSLYERMLSIPLMGMQESWLEYQQLTENRPSSTVKVKYEAALELLKKLEPLEKAMDDSRAAHETQIQFELDHGDNARIRTAFERALTGHPLDAGLWLAYASHVENIIKDHMVAVSIYKRAVRNCPWDTQLWQCYLLAMERSNCPVDEVDRVWAMASASPTTADSALHMYRTFIYLLKRRADKREPVDYSTVISFIEEGAERLKSIFGDYDWDPSFVYRRNWAYFLYAKAKQPDKGRKLSNEILASGSGRMADVWLDAVRLERCYGNVAAARKLLFRAVNSVSDHPNTIFEAFIQFEREEGNIIPFLSLLNQSGTLADLDAALERVNAQAIRLAERPKKTTKVSDDRQGTTKGSEDRRVLTESTSKRALDTRKRTFPEQGSQKAQDLKSKIDNSDKEKHSKTTDMKRRHVDSEGFAVPRLNTMRIDETMETMDSPSSSSTMAKDALTVFVSNLDFKLSEESLRELFPNAKEIRLVRKAGSGALHKGYGFVEFSSPEAVTIALSQDRALIDGRPIFVSRYKPHEKGDKEPFKYGTGLEKNKLFVSNLHYDSSTEQLTELFSAFGRVKGVRIVTHKSGKAKGCAFVEYETEQDAANALKNGVDLVLLGRKLSVALSNPPKKSTAPPMEAELPVEQRRGGRLQLVPRSVKAKTETKPKSALSNDQFRQFLR